MKFNSVVRVRLAEPTDRRNMINVGGWRTDQEVLWI